MAQGPTRPVGVTAALYAATALTIALALSEAVQIPLGALPEDARRLEAVPVRHFVHVAAAAAFGLIGPLQFGRALAARYGRLHRVLGRVFVASGAALALSALGLLWRFPDTYSVAMTASRLVFAVALLAALGIALRAILRRDVPRHRAWMIRAYAVGMGATATTNLFLPVYLATGAPPEGPLADAAFVGAWLACLALGEAAVRRGRARGGPRAAAAAA